jgi:hypothetical protein
MHKIDRNGATITSATDRHGHHVRPTWLTQAVHDQVGGNTVFAVETGRSMADGRCAADSPRAAGSGRVRLIL